MFISRKGCRREDRHKNTVVPRQPPVIVGNCAEKLKVTKFRHMIKREKYYSGLKFLKPSKRRPNMI